MTRYCLQCSYILEGLTENRCPECGRPFDPEQSSTYTTRPWKPKNRIVIVFMYLLPLALTFASFVPATPGSGPDTAMACP